MKRLKEFGFIIGILLIVSFHIFLSLPVKTSPINPPPYSAPVQILDKNGEVIAFANAFLVDRELGLLITNEHVIASGMKWRVKFGGRSYLAKTQKEWINQNADLAILRLINYQSAELPSATDLSGSAYVGLSVQARGYKYNGESYCAESVVLSLKEPWPHEDSQYSHGIKTGGGWRLFDKERSPEGLQRLRGFRQER